MTNEIGKDIVRRILEARGYKVIPSGYGVIDFSVCGAGKNFHAVVRTQNAVTIGQGGAPCYFLTEGEVDKLKNFGDAWIYFVDPERGKVFSADFDALLEHRYIDNLSFPFPIDDKIYFHIGQLPFADNVSFTDVEILQKSCAAEKSVTTDEQAVERVIELHRKKLDDMQAEFEQMIRGLLKAAQTHRHR